MRVAVVGRTEFLLESARAVAEAGHEIPLVVTSDAESHYGADDSDFRRLGAELDASVFHGVRLNDPEMVETLRSHDCSIAISMNWQTLLRRPVLESFEHGVVNCHPGDLPRYRGNAAPNWAILNGEDDVVYTLHLMTEALDAGPILSQRSMPIDDSTRIRDAYDFGVEVVPEMFTAVVDGFEDGSIDPRPQPSDPSAVLRCYPRRPADSELDWTRSATHLDRLVRASSEPLFGAFTEYDGTVLTVWRARAEHPSMNYLGTPGQVAERRPDEGEVAVIAGDGFLVLEEVETADHGRTDPTAVISSNRDRLGTNTTAEIRALRDRIQSLEGRLERLEEER